MRVTRGDLRSLLLAQQGLLGERSPAGAGGAVAWVRAHGFLMLETTSRAVAPGHDLVLFSRLSGYQAGDLEAALYERGQLIEHYLHVLGALPAADYALLHDPERAAAATQPGALGAAVLECLAAEGPCTLRDLQAHLRRHGGDAQRALGQAVRELHASAAILVRHREGSQPVYDLAQRVLPGAVGAALPAEERLQALARRILHILAPVTRATWSQVLGGVGARAGLGLSAMKREKGRLIAGMVARGEAVEVTVEGSPQPYILPAPWLEEPASHPSSAAPRVSFLSPIDPVVWDGQRARDLFDFDGRQQAYRDAVRERRLAPPALAILYGQALVGRLEVQVNWVEQRLLVHGIHLVPAQPAERHFRATFTSALQDLAAWHGARDIRAAGRLPPRLLP